MVQEERIQQVHHLQTVRVLAVIVIVVVTLHQHPSMQESNLVWFTKSNQHLRARLAREDAHQVRIIDIVDHHGQGDSMKVHLAKDHLVVLTQGEDDPQVLVQDHTVLHIQEGDPQVLMLGDDLEVLLIEDLKALPR